MANTDNISTILKVSLDAEKVSQDLAVLSKRIADVKKDQQDLNEQFKNGEVSAADYNKQMTEMKDELTWLQKEQKGLIATTKLLDDETSKYSDTLNGQRQKLADMQKAYDQMTKAQRESASGQEFLAALKDQSDAVKELEEATGRAQRNVGNYPKALQAMIPGFDKITSILGKMGVTMDGLAQKGGKAFASLGQSVKAFGKAFITPPIIVITAVLSAIMLVVQKVQEAFKKNDDAMTALQKAFAVFKPIGEAVAKVFDWVAQGLAKVATAVAGAVSWVAGKLAPSYKKAADEAQLLVERQDKLEDSERNYQVNSAIRNRKIAELRDKAVQADKYSVEERRKALQRSLELEQENLKEQKIIARERLKILETEAKLNSDTSDEMKNKIAEARAAMYQADEAYLNGKRKIDRQLQSFDKEEKSRAQAAAAEARRKRQEQERAEKEYQDFVIKTRRETEDALLSLETDQEKREIEQAKRAGERTVEDLQVKLSRLKKTDLAAREALQKLIEATEQATQNKITAIQIKSANERESKEREIAKKRAELGVKDTEQLAQMRYDAAQEEYERLQALTDEQIKALYSSQLEYENALVDAETNAYNTREVLAAEHYNKTAQRLKDSYDARMAAIDNEYVLAELEAEQKQAEYDNLLAMDEETKRALFENEEAYAKAVADSRQALSNSIAKQIQSRIKSVGELGNAFNDLSSALEGYADENEDAAKAQKAFALAGILMNQAQSISTGALAVAKGVSSAAEITFPANIPAIISIVAQIGAMIAGVMSSITQAKQIFAEANDAGNFAGGGTIKGNSYTGDKLIAHVNSGEGIYTGTQANNLLQEIANNPSRGGLDYEALGATMAAAVAAQPAPVMVLKELADAQDKVSTFNEIASI